MTEQLSLEEKATNYETMRHIERVRNLINAVVHELLHRGEIHDQSKTDDLERQTFVEYTPKLKNSTYGSDEYKGFLQEMAPALKNHYACNRHHPEHFDNGVNDMTLIDVLEMFLDWKAASERHADGNIYRSIELNQGRFGICDQLAIIMDNTAAQMFFDVDKPAGRKKTPYDTVEYWKKMYDLVLDERAASFDQLDKDVGGTGLTPYQPEIDILISAKIQHLVKTNAKQLQELEALRDLNEGGRKLWQDFNTAIEMMVERDAEIEDLKSLITDCHELITDLSAEDESIAECNKDLMARLHAITKGGA